MQTVSSHNRSPFFSTFAVAIQNSAPAIVSAPQTAFVSIYGSVNLTCVVSGSPQPSIQWFKDGAPLPGEVFPSFFIESVDLNDRGVYHCEATNSLGVARSAAAVINIIGIQQYTIDLFIPLFGFGVSSFNDEVVQKSKTIVTQVTYDSRCSVCLCFRLASLLMLRDTTIK